MSKDASAAERAAPGRMAGGRVAGTRSPARPAGRGAPALSLAEAGRERRPDPLPAAGGLVMGVGRAAQEDFLFGFADDAQDLRLWRLLRLWPEPGAGQSQPGPAGGDTGRDNGPAASGGLPPGFDGAFGSFSPELSGLWPARED